MASAAEAERYRQLLRMEMAGTIDRLETQVTFELVVNNKLITRYRADFRYEVIDDHGNVLRTVIEDVKGMVTPEFVLKQKLFDALEPVKLSVIHVQGKLKHPDYPGRDSDGAGWLHRHWNDRLPPA